MSNKDWEDIQQRTFTRWVNAQINKKGVKITDITKDFEDGLKLIMLYEVISNSQFPKVQKNPVMKIHKINNLSIVVNEVNKFVDSVGIRVTFSAEQIHDGDKRSILGMIWCLIHKFSIQDISEEELSARDGLLLWCQKQTAGYNGVKVANFNTSWIDGLAFCALIHKYRPDLIDFNSLKKDEKLKNLQLAFDVAEKHLDIPQLLDANDIANSVKPDDKSIMTYVAFYWKKFASSKKTEKSGRKIKKISERQKENTALENEYAQRAQKLISWINGKNQDLADTSNFGNSLAKVQATSNKFKDFKNTDKTKQNSEKADLELMLKNLNTKQRNEGLTIYVPPEDISTGTINKQWDSLEDQVKKYEKALKEAIQRMKEIEALLARFRTRSQQLVDWKSGKEPYLNEDIQKIDVISAIQARIKGQQAFDEEFKGVQNNWEATTKIGQQVIDAKHEAADEVQNRINDLQQTAVQTTIEKSKEVHDKLEKWLKFKQEVEALCLEFSNQVQQLNLFLEDVGLSLIEVVNVNSVQEADDKFAANTKVIETYNSKKSSLDTIQDLHRKITEHGADSGVYSSLSNDAITEKYTSVGTKLQERADEITKAKEEQVYFNQLLDEWAAACKEYSSWVDEQKAVLSKEEEGSLYDQVKALLKKSSKVLEDSQKKLAELQTKYDKLLEKDLVNRASVTMQELNVLNAQLENLVKKSTEDLQIKLKRLDAVVGRFKNRIEKIQSWQNGKKTYLDGVMNKVNSISSIQAELKTLQAMGEEFKGIQGTFTETKSLGEGAISAKHSDAEEIRKLIDATEAADKALTNQSAETEQNLSTLLKQKQDIEANCVEFAKTVQQLNLFLEDAGSQLIESVKARSVKDVEDKAEAVNKLSESYKGNSSQLDSAKSLHDSITQAGGKSDMFSGVDIDGITNKYNQVGKQLETKLAELDQEKQIQQTNAQLLKDFADASADFGKWVSEQIAELSKEEGELEKQLETLKTNGSQAVAQSADKLKALLSTYEKLEQADVAELADVTVQELTVLDQQVQNTVFKRIQTLEAQILSKKLSNVSESQLKEFYEVFKHFDAGKTGFLTKLQFKSATAAIGEDIPDDKLESTFKQYDADNDGKIAFNEFIEFMSNVAKEGLNKNDVLEAFQELAGGNAQYITEQQLRATLDTPQVDYLMSKMPKTDQGYDFAAYANSFMA